MNHDTYTGGWADGRAAWEQLQTDIRAAADRGIARRAAELGIDLTAMLELLNDDTTPVDDLLRRYGLTAADLLTAVRARVVDVDPTTYFDHDDALDRIDGEPFDPSWTRPRVTTQHGIAVRGMRRGYVIGDRTGEPETTGDRVRRIIDGTTRPATRLRYSDAVVLAHAWMTAHGDDIPMIGTDEFSWHQIVTHKPFTITTTGGAMFAVRPDGAGRSIVGTARPARRFVSRRASTATRTAAGHIAGEYVRIAVNGAPMASHDIDGWPLAADYRIRKVYGTTYDGGLHDGTRWVRWPRVGARTVTAVRRRRPVYEPMTAVAAVDAIAAAASAAHGTTEPTAVRVAVDGIRVTYSHEPTARRHRIIVTTIAADGRTVRRSTATRSAATAVAAVRRLAGI